MWHRGGLRTWPYRRHFAHVISLGLPDGLLVLVLLSLTHQRVLSALILGSNPQLSHFLLPLSLPRATTVSHLDYFKSFSAGLPGLDASGQSDPLGIDTSKCDCHSSAQSHPMAPHDSQ